MTAAGQRARERARRTAWSAAAAVGARGVQAGVSLLVVPLAFRCLGSEQLGIWMALTAAVGLLAFADLGIGNGLLNQIAQADGTEDPGLARRAVSTGAALLGALGLALVLCFLVLAPIVPWRSVFNAPPSLGRGELVAAVGVLVASFALNLPLGIAARVQMGYQEGFRSQAWQALGSLLSLGAVAMAYVSGAGLVGLLATSVAGPIAALAVSTAWEFGVRRPWLRPARADLDREVARRLTNQGALFALAQFAAMAMSGAPILLVNRLVGPDGAARYGVSGKLIGAAALLTSMWAAPLWPAYAEALSRGDAAWVRGTFRKSVAASLALSVTSAAVFALTSGTLAALLSSRSMAPDSLTVVGFCLYLVAHGLRWVASMPLNASNQLRGQVVYQVLAGGAAIAASPAAAARLGIGGVALAFGLAEALVAVAMLTELRLTLLREEN